MMRAPVAQEFVGLRSDKLLKAEPGCNRMVDSMRNSNWLPQIAKDDNTRLIGLDFMALVRRFCH